MLTCLGRRAGPLVSCHPFATMVSFLSLQPCTQVGQENNLSSLMDGKAKAQSGKLSAHGWEGAESWAHLSRARPLPP